MTARLESGDTVALLEIEKGFRDAALRGGNILFTKFLSDMKDSAPVCPECATQKPMENLGGDVINTLIERSELFSYRENITTCSLKQALPIS